MNILLAAAETAAAEETNPLLEPHLGLMIWTLITFVIALLMLRKWAFGPIQEALEQRRTAIVESVEAAERTKTEAEGLLTQYQDKLDSARDEAEQIVSRARQAGDELTSQVRDEAAEQRRKAIEDTQRQVEVEIEKATATLTSALAEMTAKATESVTRGALDANSHRDLIDQAVKELDVDSLQKTGSGASS